MKKKGYTAAQIIGKLREAEVLLSQGSTVGEVSRRFGVTEVLAMGTHQRNSLDVRWFIV